MVTSFDNVDAMNRTEVKEMSLEDKKQWGKYFEMDDCLKVEDVRKSVRVVKTRMLIKSNSTLRKVILEGGSIDINVALKIIDEVFGFNEDLPCTNENKDVKGEK